MSIKIADLDEYILLEVRNKKGVKASHKFDDGNRAISIGLGLIMYGMTFGVRNKDLEFVRSYENSDQIYQDLLEHVKDSIESDVYLFKNIEEALETHTSDVESSNNEFSDD